MRSALPLLFTLCSALQGLAQFPLTRNYELRVGQRRPFITALVQDSLGLIWAGSEMGLLRTDGEEVEVVQRTEGERVTAMLHMEGRIVAALADGRVLGCDGLRCDTLLLDTTLVQYPVRALATDAGGGFLMATYGAGIWSFQNGVVRRIGGPDDLPDLHVNGLCRLSDGRLVAATDQGLALIDGDRVVDRFGEEQGAPDNLVLAVAADGDRVWAGTDRAGVFQWTPGAGRSDDLGDLPWTDGPVTALATQGGDLWVGTARKGMLFIEQERGIAVHRQQLSDARDGRVLSVMVDREGAAWWTQGSEQLVRADPNVLLIPEHEGMDLRGISALTVDDDERLWFATPDGLFRHATTFAEGSRAERLPVRIEPHAPIVALSPSPDGTVWGASFGAGAYAFRPSGRVERITAADGPGISNLLAVKTSGSDVWFAGLEGIVQWSNGRLVQHVPPGTGFVYDVLPLEGGGVLGATDGSGVVHGQGDGRLIELPGGPRTCYSLLRDALGGIWTAGPGTGLCAVSVEGLSCGDPGRPPFDGDLYGLGRLGDQVVVLGRTAVAAFDPGTALWTDLTARTGLEGVEAELNATCNDARGTLWFACNRGLMRVRPALLRSGQPIPTVITGMVVGGEAVAVDTAFRTPHDRNTMTLRFTGLHYADPGALRFEVELSGPEQRRVVTRDREFILPELAPGNHRFRVRAFLGDTPDRGTWAGMTITVDPPWWRLPWVVALAIAMALGIAVYVLRSRERRFRQREALEREKVRFQLEALRSQVDPHFLFNSFNTLVELIASDPEVAIEQVERLSTFFRSILLLRDRDLITLEEELDLLGTYYQLERQRFGAAIELEVEVPSTARRKRVVPLTLQMLVENAWKHNTATLEAPLTVQVGVEEGVLVVRNGIRPRLSPARSTGFGLDSIRKRYATLSDRPLLVKRDEGFFEVRVPLIDAEHEGADR